MRRNTWITLAALSVAAGCGDRDDGGSSTGAITGGITASSTTTDSDSDTGKDIFDLGPDGNTSDSSPPPAQVGAASPFGLWGALGTRASKEVVEDF